MVPIGLAPYSDKRALGLMAPCPPPNCLCHNVLLHVLFKAYFLVMTCADLFVIVFESSKCVKLFFSTLIDCYVLNFSWLTVKN
jgi:hypothetical protein